MCDCEKTVGYLTPCYINCVECNTIINYTMRSTYKNSLKRSKYPKLCQSCLKKGIKNPFYEKKHSKESMEKMLETSKNSIERQKYYEKIKSEEYRKELSEKLKKNPPMKNNSYYKIWVKKYGQETADKMNKECSLKKSVKGERNFWFGKTPPYGSGNGWSGWYKGWFFRSLLELSYMVNVIEKNNLKWETGESSKYKIVFTHKNQIKNYFPDFIIEDREMIECKPKNLWQTELIINKSKAAEDFCKKNKLIYSLIDIEKLSHEEIYSLYEKKDLIWIDRYQKKFEERYEKKLLNNIKNKIDENISNRRE